MATVPLSGAPGFRFFKDLYPTGRDGGMSYYPYSSIASGLTPSTSIVAAAPALAPTVTIAVAAGRAYLDGQLATLASNSNVTLNVLAGRNGITNYDVFLNPTRKLVPIPLGGALPTTLLNGVAVQDGDMYATCVDFGEYFGATEFYLRSAGAWGVFDPSFSAPELPAQPGKNRAFGGANRSVVTASNLTINQVEKRMYIENMYPPYTNSNSKALIRDSASLFLGTVALYVHVLPRPVTATFTNGNAAVTVAAADRALVADIAASVSNTNTLQIDGATLNAAGYNSGTGVITLGAVYAGTTGTKVVNITPVTAGNIHVVSPALSSVILRDPA